MGYFVTTPTPTPTSRQHPEQQRHDEGLDELQGMNGLVVYLGPFGHFGLYSPRHVLVLVLHGAWRCGF